MKTNLGTLMDSSQSLANLSQCDMPFEVGFRVSLFLEEVQSILNHGFKKQDELAKKYKGKLDTKKALTALGKLRDEQIDLKIPNIKISELIKSKARLAPRDFTILKWLIEDDISTK